MVNEAWFYCFSLQRPVMLSCCPQELSSAWHQWASVILSTLFVTHASDAPLVTTHHLAHADCLILSYFKSSLVKIHIFTPCSVVISRGLLRFFPHNNWFLHLSCELIAQSVLMIAFEWAKFHLKCQF